MVIFIRAFTYLSIFIPLYINSWNNLASIYQSVAIMNHLILNIIIGFLLWNYAHCDMKDIDKQIDGVAIKIQFLLQQLTGTLSLWSQQKSILEQANSELLSSYINAINKYQNLQMVFLSCSELELNRSIVQVAHDGLTSQCPQAPIGLQYESAYNKSIYLSFIQKDILFNQNLLNQQQSFNNDYQNQQNFFIKLQDTAYKSIQNSITKYKNCISVYTTPQNQNPVECASYNRTINARGVVFDFYRGTGMGFGRMVKLPMMDIYFKNISLLTSQQSFHQLTAQLTPYLHQLTEKLTSCQLNATNYLNLTNEALNAVSKAKENLEVQLQKLINLHSDISSLATQLPSSSSSPKTHPIN